MRRCGVIRGRYSAGVGGVDLTGEREAGNYGSAGLVMLCGRLA